MRLKKIRLAGFKSFVDPTNIPFPDDMTAIVGPNGCGKSNVIDAVRWVLGESSAKNLRGDAMTDVIFNGSSSRRPVSLCSVELVFDNSSQRIQGEYAAYNEISVKRQVTREAQSTYFLNGSKCRRRDVTDLFLGTGLGPRSYAIIEQGMISRLIESKPHELRVFIEEAAGVSKYKERRRETENRIRHTRDNLERLGDVRNELGQQLEKLQRQASAAKRYTELKAKERLYKGQLAAIRWLKHSDKILALETQIKQGESDIEAYVAKQRGDEKEITTIKEAMAELKQQQSDCQQQFYLLGNEVTRLEQNKVFRLQRESQLKEEISSAEELRLTLHSKLQETELVEADLLQQFEQLEPEELILAERLLDAEDALEQLQEQWSQKQKQWRDKEQQYSHLKQQAQSRHSQIQGLLQVQLRTEKRISELQQELQQAHQPQLSEERELLSFKLEEQQQLTELNSEQHVELTGVVDTLQQEHTELSTKQQEQHQLLTRLDAQLQSATSLYQRQFAGNEERQIWLEAQKSGRPLWDYLQVDEKWQFAVETVLQLWLNGWTVPFDTSQKKPPVGMKVFFTDKMSSEKPTGTLASCCANSLVPDWLSRVHLVGSLEEALSRRQDLQSAESYITEDGLWVGIDWMISGPDSNSVSPLQQKAEIEALGARLESHRETLAATECLFNSVDKKLADARSKKAELELALSTSKLESQHLFQQLKLLDNQLQQLLNKRRSLEQELEQQKELLEEESLQLEELAIQVEEFELQIDELQHNHDDIEYQREQQELKLDSARQVVEQLKSQQHNLALKIQDNKFKQQNCQNTLNAGKKELQSTEQKLLKLNAELTEVLQPGTGQQQKLDTLLEEKQQLSQKQTDIQQQLQHFEEQLADSEKDQVGVQQRVASMRAELQSLALEIERNRTRANTFVEQLQEMQQSLKSILQALPEDSDEDVWRQELDKTTAALQRLGAVNLAAVEEFEQQSERKKHLDTQNDDLTAALDTLETAIKKIDRETRSRFKETFEKVNDDVKMLFPKVFGGGAAWLELTGDDLLETGVTIMARPPGKKNSTIHLLSGGEKALTALSLVFAIFRLNPAPFCLLDEVDAPLDDANVGRFCKLVSEMSKSVQFIFITHNKIAMEMAYHLTGVTMAEPGVSRIVAVDVEEAVAIANA